MGKQMTEMLKGTLEGIVLAILSVRPAYGYEITARLREQGFSDIAEGTVYALLIRFEQKGLVDVEKIPSEKGPPRKVYSLNAQGQEYLDEFWRTWSFLADNSISSMEEADEQVHLKGDRREAAMAAAQGAHARASRELSNGVEALERYLMYAGPGGDGARAASMFEDLLDLFEQSAANGTPIREIVGRTPWSSSRRSFGTTRMGTGEPGSEIA